MQENYGETKPLLAVLWRHKWIVLGTTTLLVGAGVAYTYFVKPVWEAKATLVFPVKSPSILGASGMTEQLSLAASLGGGPTPLKIYKGFLESERTLKIVSEETGLKRRDVKEMRKLVDQAMESSLTVTARNQDPELAKRVVALHLDALAKINEEMSDPLNSDDTEVLRAKLIEQRKTVASLEHKLLQFQNSAVTAPTVAATGSGKEATVIAAPARWQDMQRQLEIELSRVDSSIRGAKQRVAKATGNLKQLPSNLPPVKKWRERLVDLEYELKVKEITYAAESPEVQKLKEAVSLTRRQLERELQAYANAVRAETIDPTNTDPSLPEMLTMRTGIEAQLAAVKRLARVAPKESIELSRLTRDLATQSSILQQLQAQFELSKIQAMRDPNRWQVLDVPEVDDKPVNKSYGKNGAIALFLGLILGSMLSLIRESFGQRKGRLELGPTQDLPKAA